MKPFNDITPTELKAEILEGELKFIANMVPLTPETVNEFIGINFEEYHHSVDEYTFAEDDRITLTIKDLIKCFQRWKDENICSIVWDESND